MRFARDKSLLLAALALLAPLPLPLNEVVGWGSVLAFVAVVGIFLKRTLDGLETLLPYWAMNLLGLLYLPFLFLDLTVLRQGRFLQPLVHLAMFALVVKLYAMHREKDKWHVLLTVFFIFVASVGTSVHPSVFPYMVVFLALSILTLTRFSGMHMTGEVDRAQTRLPRVPVRAFVSWTVVLVILGAAPLFFLMPRLRQPYVWAPTAGSGSSVQVSGFTDRLDLDVIGRLRTSRAVVMRYSYETSVRLPIEQRFKVAVFDRFESGTWLRSQRPVLPLNRSIDGLFYVVRERPTSWIGVWQRTGGSGRLVLPVETRAVDLAANSVAVEETGAASLVFPPPSTVEYRVGLGSGPAIASPQPVAPTDRIDQTGISPEVAALAAEIAGEETPLEQIRRIESHLLQNYSYTLDLGGQPTDRPIERFLFETREGHCEYFVSAMVLMLRSRGIPARVVNGYLGADFNSWQGYFVVRQSHAHAWVEAWTQQGGWRIFDPTPPSGRPVVGRTGLGTVFEQAWDAVLFRWDRYVLTYGFADQVDTFIRLRELLAGIWDFFDRRDQGRQGSGVESTPVASQEEAEDPAETGQLEPGWEHAAPFAIVALAVLAWLWWQREGFSATSAYRQLRARVLRSVPDSSASTPPLEIERLAGEQAPEARNEAHKVVAAYLDESFGDRKLAAEELAEVRRALRETGRQWKKGA